MVVIDSLSGYLNAMPDEQFMILQMHELVTYLNQQGVVTILILAQSGMVGHVASPLDLTYLSDTVLSGIGPPFFARGGCGVWTVGRKPSRSDRSAPPRVTAGSAAALRQAVQRALPGLLNRAQYPSDVIALVVLWRLRYKLSLRDLPEMFAVRGIVFSYEAVREWEAKLTRPWPMYGARHGSGDR